MSVGAIERVPFDTAVADGRIEICQDEIDPKYHFLLDAPKKDPEGRPAVIRYSRKTKEQYVQSEVDGKPTGWRAFFSGGKWKVESKG